MYTVIRFVAAIELEVGPAVYPHRPPEPDSRAIGNREVPAALTR